jgi:hypothetical protein
MSLRDYDVKRDKFEFDEHTSWWCFPCCVCKHCKKRATEEPCRTCDHNVRSEPEDAVAKEGA